MKKDELTELEKINEKKKMPLEVKKEIMKKIYKNVLIAIYIIAFLLLLFAKSNSAEKIIRITGFNIFSMLLLLISITIFEISYKKDNDCLAIHGIEILLVAIATLFMPYMYFEATGLAKKLYMLMPTYVGLYYGLKMIIIAIRENKKYKLSVSEMKELIKKEDKKEIDLEEKRNKRKNSETVTIIDPIEKEKENDEELKKEKIENNSVDTQHQKREIEKQKENNKKTATKKSKTNKKTANNMSSKIKTNQEVIEKPKRGRPRKVVEE